MHGRQQPDPHCIQRGQDLCPPGFGSGSHGRRTGSGRLGGSASPFWPGGSSRGLTHVSFFLLWALSFFLFSFKPVLVGGEGEISFQFPPPLLQSRAALGEREALKHSGQADFSGYSPPPPTPAPPPHDWGWGWRAALVPTPPAETRAGGTQRRRWKGKKKRALGMAKKSSPFSPPESRLPLAAFL